MSNNSESTKASEQDSSKENRELAMFAKRHNRVQQLKAGEDLIAMLEKGGIFDSRKSLKV